MHSIGRAILQDKVPLHVHKNKGGKAIKKFHHFKKKSNVAIKNILMGNREFNKVSPEKQR